MPQPPGCGFLYDAAAGKTEKKPGLQVQSGH